MQLRHVVLFLAMVLAGSRASAEAVRVDDLNTRQIRALDRDRTVVFLQGGMLEEHGPYLPAFTDGILSERLTSEIANGGRDRTAAADAQRRPAGRLAVQEGLPAPRLRMARDQLFRVGTATVGARK